MALFLGERFWVVADVEGCDVMVIFGKREILIEAVIVLLDK